MDIDIVKRFIYGAKEAYKKVDNHSYNFPITIESAYRLATNIETLLKEQDNCENCAIAIEDRQPVVRCKDCKWWHESKTNNGFGDCGQANGITLKPSDWFCADGKRR